MASFVFGSQGIPSIPHEKVASQERQMYDDLMERERDIDVDDLHRAEKHIADQEKEDLERYEEMLKSKTEKPMDRVGRFNFSPVANIANAINNADVPSVFCDEKRSPPTKKQRCLGSPRGKRSLSQTPINQSSVIKLPTPISRKRPQEPPSLIGKKTSGRPKSHHTVKSSSGSRWLSNMLNTMDAKVFLDDDGGVLSEREDDLLADDGQPISPIAGQRSHLIHQGKVPHKPKIQKKGQLSMPTDDRPGDEKESGEAEPFGKGSMDASKKPTTSHSATAGSSEQTKLLELQATEKQREKERKKLAKAEEIERAKQEKAQRANERKMIQQESMVIKKAQLKNRQKRVELEASKITHEVNKHAATTTMADEDAEEVERRIEMEMWSAVANGTIPKVKPNEGQRDTSLQNSGTVRPRAGSAHQTFLITFPAKQLLDFVSENGQGGDWYSKKDGFISLNKEKLHLKFRECMFAFNQAIPKQYRWSWEAFHSACFVEKPLKESDLITAIEEDAAESMTHGHIVAVYEGSQGRGLRGSHTWDHFLLRFGLPGTTSVYCDTMAKQQHREAKSTILNYLCLPKKGFVDLLPHYSENFQMPSSVQKMQYNQLISLQRKVCEPWEFQQYLLSLESGIPDTLGVITENLDTIIKAHDRLQHTNRDEWRRQFFDVLPYYQFRRYASTKFTDDDAFPKYKELVLASLAEKHRSWDWWDYFLDGLRQECTCSIEEPMDEQGNEELVCLECDDADDRTAHLDSEIMQGQTTETVKQLVRESSLYESMKRTWKFRSWAEPEFKSLEKLSRHVYALMTRARSYLSNRRMNIHIKGKKGDSGKSAVLYCIVNLFNIQPYSHHLIHRISNHKFLLNCSRSKLYAIRVLNDMSADCLSGSQLKSLFESDEAQGNVKQGSVTFQTNHPPVWVSSNLASQTDFVKAKKEMGPNCAISLDDFCKLLTLKEGRIGTEIVLDLPVPKVWQRRYGCCRRCSALFIRWLLGLFISGPSKIKAYQPTDFYENSDADSEGDSHRYTKDTPKMKIITKTIGQKKVKSEEMKYLLHVSEKDLMRLAKLDEIEKNQNKASTKSRETSILEEAHEQTCGASIEMKDEVSQAYEQSREMSAEKQGGPSQSSKCR